MSGFVTGDGFVRFALGVECITEIVIGISRLWIQLNCSQNEVDRLLVSVVLMQDDSEQVKSIRMLSIGYQDVAIVRFGSLKIPGVVLADTQGQFVNSVLTAHGISRLSKFKLRRLSHFAETQ